MKTRTFLVVGLMTSAGSGYAALRKSVTTDYTLLRRGPHSYVVGTAYRDWTVDIQQEASEGYRWGHIYGSLNACLWIFQDAVSAGGAEVPAACRSENRIIPDEAFLAERYGGEDDGAAIFVTVDAGLCPTWDGIHVVGYGNVRPWQDATEPSEGLQTLVPLGGSVLRRYLTRDRRFVMVRDPQLGATDGVGLQSWFFLPASCLTDQPPPPPPPPVDAAPPPPPPVDAAPPPPPPVDAAVPPADAFLPEPADVGEGDGSLPIPAEDAEPEADRSDREIAGDTGTSDSDASAPAAAEGTGDCHAGPGGSGLGLLLLFGLLRRRP